ncbi:uncharacterized protein K489DRAFT_25428 [Dissoconium aciculare CBS 342.82]|uniref:Uncharacterized protein n=1 Tax=Dissoconium aciculare CBS 342.82 TaxID=1314786 RepID=A0A6J3ML59_9PEZI|nr:uncharacterized protein K489DRAFT_25428 [Dissoconium aciculare CBS 342.82]KAF1827732.1 hypothetical protein K489DRAFT_25428 [Dissoconium aciculare CBS 342.82]
MSQAGFVPQHGKQRSGCVNLIDELGPFLEPKTSCKHRQMTLRIVDCATVCVCIVKCLILVVVGLLGSARDPSGRLHWRRCPSARSHATFHAAINIHGL